MDPNANLKSMLEIAKRIEDGEENEGDADRLADLILALDEWIRRGGFLPSAWMKNR